MGLLLSGRLLLFPPAVPLASDPFVELFPIQGWARVDPRRESLREVF